tara:strand:- start:12149 stop:12463 length:315 start_codon:yes stop_codon:yes gene_type:complete
MKTKCAVTSVEANAPDLRSSFAQHTSKAVGKRPMWSLYKQEDPIFWCSFYPISFGFHASVARVHSKNRLKYDRWKQLSALIDTVRKSGSMLRKRVMAKLSDLPA